ncbi:MAG TPA: ribosome maturation factor RimP [Actinobacteria bacterium]|nr:ribosome maturation factor RimP [Actinomycetota bacterium]
MTASEDRVWAVVEPVVQDQGYDLEALSVMAAGRRRLVKIVIDSDLGVDLDDVARISSEVSRALDDADAMGETPYVLEVTSPGVDRPLTLERHCRRAASRLVKVTLTDGESITGRVASTSETSATLVNDDDATSVDVAFADVEKAVVQIEFNRSRINDELSDEIDEFDDNEGGQ